MPLNNRLSRTGLRSMGSSQAWRTAPAISVRRERAAENRTCCSARLPVSPQGMLSEGSAIDKPTTGRTPRRRSQILRARKPRAGVPAFTATANA